MNTHPIDAAIGCDGTIYLHNDPDLPQNFTDRCSQCGAPLPLPTDDEAKRIRANHPVHSHIPDSMRNQINWDMVQHLESHGFALIESDPHHVIFTRMDIFAGHEYAHILGKAPVYEPVPSQPHSNMFKIHPDEWLTFGWNLQNGRFCHSGLGSPLEAMGKALDQPWRFEVRRREFETGISKANLVVAQAIKLLENHEPCHCWDQGKLTETDVYLSQPVDDDGNYLTSGCLYDETTCTLFRTVSQHATASSDVVTNIPGVEGTGRIWQYQDNSFVCWIHPKDQTGKAPPISATSPDSSNALSLLQIIKDHPETPT